MKKSLKILFILLVFFSCETGNNKDVKDGIAENKQDYYFEGMYVPFKLTADLSALSEKEKDMIPLLIEAADIMDRLFWQEAYGKKDSLFELPLDRPLLDFARINYGPWDRLNDNKPFIEGVGEKPRGANFYPADMTREEFEQSELPGKDNLYTMIRRGADGNLQAIPYRDYFKAEVEKAADLLDQAAALVENEELKKYLTLRAKALLTDEYLESDLAWMEMTSNTLDVVIGPIETYEDKLFGYKAAHEAYILIKDKEWSRRLERYAAFLPELQKNLPVPEAYKKEQPGTEGQLNAYDVIYYAGDCNAGSKTIAINLPNDERVQLSKGTRRLQLKNAMRAKFDRILIPIADVLIEDASKGHITFDAFFANTMFHEVAHGLGIKNTITGNETVRSALKEHSSAIEEGKADILGLYMITELHNKEEVEGDLDDYYTTFLAGIFRSIRFGAETAHGKANMIRFNFFRELDAFERDPDTGKYRVNIEQMQHAVRELSHKILVLQGDGNYQEVSKFVEDYSVISPELRSDLEKLGDRNIPVDIIFEQGIDILGL
jgi:hypothetical protein